MMVDDLIKVEILKGLDNDELAAEIAAQRDTATSLARLVDALRDQRDKLRILNEHLEKENSALRFEVERLQKRVDELSPNHRRL